MRNRDITSIDRTRKNIPLPIWDRANFKGNEGKNKMEENWKFSIKRRKINNDYKLNGRTRKYFKPLLCLNIFLLSHLTIIITLNIFFVPLIFSPFCLCICFLYYFPHFQTGKGQFFLTNSFTYLFLSFT